MAGKTSVVRIALPVAIAALVLALAPTALADKGGGGGHGGGHGGTTCTPSAPGVSVENNWGWGATGSWGLPGQQLRYMIDITNYDIGCASSSFVVSVSAPSGFSVSIPSNAITLNSGSIGYLSGYVTSPSVIADGDYPLTVTVQRGTSSSASTTSYYKVYSSDTVAPSLFWSNPADGGTVSGRSYNVTVSSSDNHVVKKLELYIDNVYKSSTPCDDVTYICQLSYPWSSTPGQHTATFRSYDWMGNVGVQNVTFTVS